MNIAKKLTLVLGIVVFGLIAVFSILPKSTNSSFLAQIIGGEDEVALVMQEESYSPIVQEVGVGASGAYTLDGEELYSFRTDKRWSISHITKLMTALVADRLYMQEKPYTYIHITEEMVGMDGDSKLIRVGDEIRADDLIEAMMLTSSNDAASALAMHYGEENFVREMNNVAFEIGMADTTFVDPTGVSLQNLSTVQDLSKLGKFIFENASYVFELSQNGSGYVVDRVDGSKASMKNINKFYERADFLGGKMGDVGGAEGNLVSLFKVDERSENIIIIVLGASDGFIETENVLNNL